MADAATDDFTNAHVEEVQEDQASCRSLAFTMSVDEDEDHFSRPKRDPLQTAIWVVLVMGVGTVTLMLIEGASPACAIPFGVLAAGYTCHELNKRCCKSYNMALASDRESA